MTEYHNLFPSANSFYHALQYIEYVDHAIYFLCVILHASEEKHNIPARRTWRKLHIIVDEKHQTLACALTTADVADATALPSLSYTKARHRNGWRDSAHGLATKSSSKSHSGHGQRCPFDGCWILPISDA